MNPRDVPEEWVIAFRAKLEEHAGRLGGPGNLHEAIRHALADVLSLAEPAIRSWERETVAVRFNMVKAFTTEASDTAFLTKAAAFVRTGVYVAAERSAP
jgi:hypothetical protein